MSDDTANQPSDTLASHLLELRRRLLWVILAMGIVTAGAFVFVEQIYAFLAQPLANAMGRDDTQRLIFTGATEGFFTYMKLAFFAGIFITLPVLLAQIWMFIAPGLYKQEKHALLPYLISSPILFFLGGLCVYAVVLPTALPFFLSFQSTGADGGLPIQLEARVSEYLDLVITLFFAFGLCFQLPVLLVLLGRTGFVSLETLAKGRKYAIVLAFVVAAFITPPDILSQVLLALPLIGLYELSILLIRLSQSKKDKAGQNVAASDLSE